MGSRFALLAAMAFGLLTAGPSEGQIRPNRPGGSGGDAPAAAPPSSGTLSSITVDQLMGYLRQAEYSDLKLGEQKDNVKFIQGKIGNTNVEVALYCNQSTCNVVGFTSFFSDKIDIRKVNQYNLTKLFTKAANDADGTFTFSMEVALTGGVTTAWMVASAQRFGGQLDGMYDFFK